MAAAGLQPRHAVRAASRASLRAPLRAAGSHIQTGRQTLNVVRIAAARQWLARGRQVAPRLAAAAAAAALAAGAAAGPEGGGGSVAAPLQALGTFLSSNFIPCGLVLAVIVGWLFPGPGVAAANADAGLAATVGIFVISGLLLQRGETAAAVRATAALAYGLLAILAVTPLAAFAMLRLPVQPPEVALGLAIFCCMPTTLSTGVTLTVASSGNAAVALLLTVASNMLSVRLASCRAGRMCVCRMARACGLLPWSAACIAACRPGKP